MSKEYKQPVLSVDFKYEFDSSSDQIKHSSRACVSLDAIQSGLVKQVGANRFGVLLAILSFMDKDGKSFPSQRKLAELTGQSVNTVNKLINELLEIQVDGQHILKREMVGDGFRKRSMYYIHAGEVTATDDVDAAEENPAEEMNSKDVAVYFMELYEEEFGVGYVINWGRDLSLIKKKLLTAYDNETLMGVIEVAVKQYKANWANDKYPLPTISMICTWLGNTAYGIYKTDKDKEERQEERTAEAVEQDDTDRALNLL